MDVWWCHLRGLWVVIWPDSFKLIEVMSAQHSPVSGQILKVIHDDSDEQVNDLRKHRLDQFITAQNCLLFSEMDYWKFSGNSRELQNFCEWSTKGNAKLLRINAQCLQENTKPLCECNTKFLWAMQNFCEKMFFISYQEGTECKETDEIEVCQVASAAILLSRLIVRLWITSISW